MLSDRSRYVIESAPIVARYLIEAGYRKKKFSVVNVFKPVYGFLRVFAERCKTMNEDALQSRIFEKNS